MSCLDLVIWGLKVIIIFGTITCPRRSGAERIPIWRTGKGRKEEKKVAVAEIEGMRN